MKLVVFDVEGTLFQTRVRLPGTNLSSTVWQAIAQELGPAAVEEEVATHERWARGHYSNYLEWMRETIDIHVRYGLCRKTFMDIVNAAQYHDGVQEVLGAIDRTVYEPVLISGGFKELAARVQRDFNVNHAFAGCEYYFDEGGRVVSYNLMPCDFHGKVDFIQLMLREYGLGSDDWLFVGDGANDVPIASIAPQSFAFRAHPELSRVATWSIEDFGAILEVLNSENRA